MDAPRVTLQHVRRAQLNGRGVLCAPGIRAWCKHHQVDLRELCLHGLPLAQVEAIDDAFARRVAALVRNEVAHG